MLNRCEINHTFERENVLYFTFQFVKQNIKQIKNNLFWLVLTWKKMLTILEQIQNIEREIFFFSRAFPLRALVAVKTALCNHG